MANCLFLKGLYTLPFKTDCGAVLLSLRCLFSRWGRWHVSAKSCGLSFVVGCWCRLPGREFPYCLEFCRIEYGCCNMYVKRCSERCFPES